MKSLLQVLLFGLLIIVGLYSYDNYFIEKKKQKTPDIKIIKKKKIQKAKKKINKI